MNKQIVAVLLVICGCLLYPSVQNTVNLINESRSFVKTVMDEQVPTLDTAKIFARNDPEFLDQERVKDWSILLQQQGDLLGRIRSIDSIDFSGFSFGSGVHELVVDYKVKLNGDNENALATLKVAHRANGQWFLTYFKLNSAAFEKLNERERAEAEAFADQVVPIICNGFKLETLSQYADRTLLDDISKNSEKFKLNFLYKQTFGRYRMNDGWRFAGYGIQDGHAVYQFKTATMFENKPIKGLSVTVLKEDGQWKLREFRI